MRRNHRLSGGFRFPHLSKIYPMVQSIANSIQTAGFPLRVSCSGGASGFSWLIMKKLTLGRTTIHSIKIQVTCILRSLHVGDFQIKKLTPLRRASGNFVRVDFRTSADPGQTHGRVFAVERVGNCCDVWLEPEANLRGENFNQEAA